MEGEDLLGGYQLLTKTSWWHQMFFARLVVEMGGGDGRIIFDKIFMIFLYFNLLKGIMFKYCLWLERPKKLYVLRRELQTIW